MPHADSSVVISAPVEKVFAAVADGLQNSKWRPAVIDIALVGGETGQKGAMYKQGLKGPGGRRIAGDYVITEYVPGQVLAFHVTAGPARPNGRFTFASEGDGTKVAFSLDLETKGFQMLMNPMITATMRHEVGTLANLKRYVETGA